MPHPREGGQEGPPPQQAFSSPPPPPGLPCSVLCRRQLLPQHQSQPVTVRGLQSLEEHSKGGVNRSSSFLDAISEKYFV